MTATTFSADQSRGTVTASTETFSMKSAVAADGTEQEFIEGFLATTHVDKGNDEFTPEALRMMAKDITQTVKEVDAVFNDVDQEALVGNMDHNNNPVSPFGDTRIVPAFKIVDAQVRDTDDDEKGLWIKGRLNSDGMMPDTVSAVKNSIKNDFLNAFSIEFVPKKVTRVMRGEKTVRVIEKAEAKGAALTGRPMNPEASMTDADLKSMTDEFVEVKQDFTVQTPDYSTTSEGSWSKPAMEDFPDDYDVTSIFLARNSESDNFSDQALPVVDYRDGEPTLVLEALRSAHQLAAQVDGLSDDEVAQVRSKAEDLAEKEFDVMLSGEAGAEHMEKNDTMTMSEDDTPEEPEDGSEADEVEEKSEGEGEENSVKTQLEELKSEVQSVKERNEELEEENEELKSEIEDFEQLQEIKSEVGEVKEILEDVDLEDGPRTRQDQERFDTKSEDSWKDKVDSMPDSFLKSEGANGSNLDAYAQKISRTHDVSAQEVKNYVNTD